MSPEDLLQSYLDKLSQRSPRLKEIFDRSKSGEMDAETAMAAALQEVGDDPSLQRDLELMALEVMAPASELWRPSGDKPEMIFKGAKGLPGLNPLFEAALTERIQFDGDIPELRYGPIPEGVLPAVSVQTRARNPALVGQMMKNASEQVRAEIDVHEGQRRKDLEAIAEGTGPAAIALMAKHGEMVAQMDVENYGSAETDLAVYKRGQDTAPIKVPQPSASSLIAMSPQERRERAWQFLSTTQGRRTALIVIRELVAKNLTSAGLTVTERDFDPKSQEEPLASHEWSLTLSGPGATQDSFSVIDVAARALGKGLERKLLGLKVRPNVFLEVAPINTVDVRVVGWMARIL